jgi:uncharacterized protein with ParB-like and HNH nuclease domain
MKPGNGYLLKILSSKDVTFFIPPYQRNYDWDEGQCRVFLNDILQTAKKNLSGVHAEHFFGSIVYVTDEQKLFNEPDKLILIDGQQRITTVMLFLVAVRDSIEDEGIKDSINKQFLRNDNVSNDLEYKIKLKQVEADWDSYRSIILGQDLSEKGKDSSVYRNYSFFMERLSQIKATGELKLDDLINKGLSQFMVVQIELQPKIYSWENPQEIFESMNSLGKPLSLADLVRNYLLMGKSAEEQTELYNDYWLKIEKLLSNNISQFIRDFMQMKAGRWYKKASDNNYKELYGNFKDLFGNQKAEDTLKEIESYSFDYSAIYLGTSSGSRLIDYALADLRESNASTSYSFFLALVHDWRIGKMSENDLASIIKAFNIYTIRRRILKLVKGENKALPGLVKDVNELETAPDKTETTFKVLSAQEYNLRLPNDAELSTQLASMNFYNFDYSEYILALVEEELTKARPDIHDDAHLQIEHVMPQTLNSDWESELGPNFEEIHTNYVHSIGNLCLIRHNQELGNKKFSEKKVIYQDKAGLQIARTNIVNCEKWNEESIKNRTTWIVDEIVSKVLAIPDSLRKTNNYNIKETKEKKALFSFEEHGLVGETIDFIADPSITAYVSNDREVEFEGKTWKLSPLTREIEERKGTVSESRAYQGCQYWEYDGTKLSDL